MGELDDDVRQGSGTFEAVWLCSVLRGVRREKERSVVCWRCIVLVLLLGLSRSSVHVHGRVKQGEPGTVPPTSGDY